MIQYPPNLYRQRRQSLCEQQEDGILLLIRGDAPFYEDLFYLTGLTSYHTALLIDFRNGDEIGWIWPVEREEVSSETDLSNLLASSSLLGDALDELSRRKPQQVYLGVRGEGLSTFPIELNRKVGCRIRDAAGLLAPRRQIKDTWEIACLRRAQESAEKVMHDVLENLKSGVSEREIAADILAGLVGRGATRPSFPIVAFGEHTVRTHHHATERVLTPGDLVLIDIYGEAADQYCAELTETLLFEGDNPLLIRRIDTVNRIFNALIVEVNPGITLRELEMLARDYFSIDGFEKDYINSRAHDVGLSEHDPTDECIPLVAGRVLALEPNLYSEKMQAGIRKEGMVTCV